MIPTTTDAQSAVTAAIIAANGDKTAAAEAILTVWDSEADDDISLACLWRAQEAQCLAFRTDDVARAVEGGRPLPHFFRALFYSVQVPRGFRWAMRRLFGVLFAEDFTVVGVGEQADDGDAL